jgi:hypothetical protein
MTDPKLLQAQAEILDSIASDINAELPNSWDSSGQAARMCEEPAERLRAQAAVLPAPDGELLKICELAARFTEANDLGDEASDALEGFDDDILYETEIAGLHQASEAADVDYNFFKSELFQAVRAWKGIKRTAKPRGWESAVAAVLSDAQRLNYLEEGFRLCPHMLISFNDDPDDDSVVDGVGYFIEVDGCDPVLPEHTVAPTLREAIDKLHGWQSPEDAPATEPRPVPQGGGFAPPPADFGERD